MSNDKLAERTQIAIEFGLLLQPLTVLADAESPPPLTKYRLARAQLDTGLRQWSGRVNAMCTFGDVVLKHEKSEIVDAGIRLLNRVGEKIKQEGALADSQIELRAALETAKSEFATAIGNLSFDVEPTLSEANTPFTVHLRLLDLIHTVQRRIHYFDRYLTAEFFPLYLRDVNRSAEVRLVTTRGSAQFGVVNVQPQAAIASQEFTDFRLMEVSQRDLHGRHLRIDDSVFNLGSSVQHAGLHPTSIDPGDSSPSGHQVLDTLLKSGTRIV